MVATDFGLSTNADDNAAALQRALDAAKGGGTVYVPAGMYSFKGPVTVPTGVELLDSSAAPHHTAAGGSVLLVRYGKGDENGAPFISLAPKSGLRGVLVWYPENPVLDPEPYPWAVRSLGEDTWLADVCIANAWRGADFATHPSGGHRIAYLSGVAWQKMLVIGNSSRRGWVEETLFNPHYSQRLAFNLPHVDGKPPAECPAGGVNIPVQSWNMRRRLEAHVFTDCADERIRGTFVFAAKDGMAFRGKNRATVPLIRFRRRRNHLPPPGEGFRDGAFAGTCASRRGEKRYPRYSSRKAPASTSRLATGERPCSARASCGCRSRA